jgi:hypothetical protein
VALSITTELRIGIASALQAAGLPAFPSQPATAPLPAVVLNPGSPYLTVTGLGRSLSYRVELVASVTAPAFDTAAALATLESLIDSTVEALPDGVVPSTISSPRLEYLGEGQGSVYLAEVTLSALIKKE